MYLAEAPLMEKEVAYVHVKLGQILKRKGMISGSQLVRALDQQKLQGGKLGHILMNQELVSEQDLVLALHEQLQIPIVDFRKAPVTRDTVALVPEDFAIEHLVLPLVLIRVKKGQILVVAMEDPTRKDVIAQLSHATGFPIKPLLAARTDLTMAIRNAYPSFHKESIISL